MRRIAESNGGDLTEFHERQLVHALAGCLPEGLWMAFEYRYYADVGGGWLSGRSDLHVMDTTRRRARKAWLEVKSTGLSIDGWDNSHLRIWAHDIAKLDQVARAPLLQAGWVWLFLFETYQKQVRRLGRTDSWYGPADPRALAPTFGSVTTANGRLARSLHDFGEFCAGRGNIAEVSVIPVLNRATDNVGRSGRKTYSALLATVTVS